MTFQWRSTDGLFMVRVCSFRYGVFVRFVCVVYRTDVRFLPLLGVCARFSLPIFFSYKTVLTERTKRKERDTHPSSRPKKMGKRIQTIPSLSLCSLRNYSEPFPPLEKNTHNAAIQAPPPAPPAAVASSQGAPLLSGEPCFCRGFLAETSGTTTQISTSHLPVLKVFPRAVLSRNLRFVCIVWSVRG